MAEPDTASFPGQSCRDNEDTCSEGQMVYGVCTGWRKLVKKKTIFFCLLSHEPAEFPYSGWESGRTSRGRKTHSSDTEIVESLS